ncbi:unnamed protein product [Vicia faba]|uniref:Uncharacterized protein n=1 Tax=Vicia faba TaxID=3906 RepID=A0AAV1AVV9_VICFA|nr:unnamed protein product [Vicia faba]
MLSPNSASAASYKSLSAYLSFNERKPDGLVTTSVSIEEFPEAYENTRIEENNDSNIVSLLSGGQSPSLPLHLDANGDISKVDSDRKELQSKDGINAVLDSQSILVLTSSRNASRGTLCQ